MHNGAMALSYSRLADDEIAEHLARLPGWGVENGMLTKLFEFECYAKGVVFAAACGHIAELLNHHPDLLIGYGKVRVQTCTHDSGNVVTGADVVLAMKIEHLLTS